MFSNILVPIDFTPKTDRAVQVAAQLLRGRDGQVTLLHVIELLDAPMEEFEEFYQQLEEKARHRLEALASPLREAGVSLVQHIRYGSRVEEILRYASDEGHDLVLLGSHRLDPEQPASNLMTISHQVAILAECPVLIVK